MITPILLLNGPRIFRAVPLVVGCLLFLLGCSPSADNGSFRPRTYAHPVKPGITFQMSQGREISPERLDQLLLSTRILFLGEHHTDTRSHDFQREILAKLIAQKRPIAVALEMFPPSANEALEGWRTGKLDELEFLETSGWYNYWRFPWSYYKDVLEVIRTHKIPVKGVNAEKATRNAVRKGETEQLSPTLQKDLIPLAPDYKPHSLYLEDTLGRAGHTGSITQQSPMFQSFRRVQWLWDRLIGVRSARMAEEMGEDGIVVVLVGSGHLAYNLGANLQAAQVSALPQLSIWDDVVVKKGKEQVYPVPLGISDLVRIYEFKANPKMYPHLRYLLFDKAPQGVKVKKKFPFASPAFKSIKAGDVIVSLNNIPVKTPTSLRLAFEKLEFGTTAQLEILRDGKPSTISLPIKRPGKH